MSQHGGKREGAGRPPKADSKRITIRLSKSEKDMLDKLSKEKEMTFKQILLKGVDQMRFKCEKCETRYEDQSSVFDLERFDNGEVTGLCRECIDGDQTALAKFLDNYPIEAVQDYEKEETVYQLPGIKILMKNGDTEII